MVARPSISTVSPVTPHRAFPLLGFALLLAVICPAAQAATFEVVNANDSGTGSLRAAMTSALAQPGDHTITFSASVNGQPIVLDSPLPPMASNVTLRIHGNGVQDTIIDGNQQYRPFKAEWANNLQLHLRDLTVRNGFADQLEGGAGYFIGATNSKIFVQDVEFVDNQATYGGGAIHAQVPIQLTRVTFTGNRSYTHGAAMYLEADDTSLRDVTIAGNHAQVSVVRLSGPYAYTFTNVTIARNQTSSVTVHVRNDAQLALINSLIDAEDEVRPVMLLVEAGSSISQPASRNNLITWPGAGGLVDGSNGNIIREIDALVGPLGMYGGKTRTLPLLPGSPAIDAGPSSGAGSTDQRGVTRVGAPDIGAFESRGFSLAAVSGGGQAAPVSSTFPNPLVVGVTATHATEPVEGGKVAFSAPTAGASATFGNSVAVIDSDGRAQTTATANGVVGGPYHATATLGDVPAINFQLTNLTGVCGAFAFPYTLSASDNAERVAELRQAIECANGNGMADEIDLGGHTLTFSDGPYLSANGANALPVVTSALVLRNGTLRRAAPTSFRLLEIDASEETRLEDLTLRGGNSTREGGGLRVAGATSTLRNVVFDGNRSSIHGGAIYSEASMLVIGGARFSDNRAPDGAVISHDNFVLAMNLRVQEHDDVISRSLFHGSQILALINTLVAGNNLAATDSSLFDYTFRPELRGVTIADNRMTGMMVHSPDAGAIGHNIIIWDNEFAGLGHIGVQFAIVQGAPPGIEHVSGLPPGFVDPPHDYRLAAGSPAIDAGDRGYSWFDILDLDDNGVLDEYLPDLDVNPRLVDDANVADTGEGPAPHIDLGAYERQADSGPRGITVAGADGLQTSENGGTATFSIVLDRYPSAPVTIALSSSDTSEGVVAPATLVFTQADWNRSHVVTVMGVPDGVVDGDQTFQVEFEPAASADPGYDGLTLASVTVTNIDTDAVAPSLALGGTVIGLAGSGLVLDLNDGDELLPIAADGSFVFATPLSTGDDYVVAVQAQPSQPAQSCVVINGSGTMGGVPVGNVVVNCGSAVTHSIGGSVSGLTGTGLTLQLNGGPTQLVAANGPYAFGPRLADGASYVVSISEQPTGQWCLLSNATGTVAGSDVDNVDVACTTAQAQLQLQIDDGHAYTRYGQVRDYLVTVSNSGNAVASGVQVIGTFSPAFDVAHVTWSCLPGSGSPCSGGAHGQADVPVGGSVTWIVSAPILFRSTESEATFTVTADGLADADTNTLVILRDGFNEPYGDGASGAGEAQPLAADEIVLLDWSGNQPGELATLGRFAAEGATVEVQRLHWRGTWLVRLLATDAAGQERSTPFVVVDSGASLGLARVGDAHDTGIEWLLEGATQPLSLSLADNVEDTGR